MTPDPVFELLTCPWRSAVAVARQNALEVRTGIRSPLRACLLPEWQPLARMAVADALHRTHQREHRCPRCRIGKMPRPRRKRPYDRGRVDPLQCVRPGEPV